MGKINNFIAAIILVFVATSCENIGLLGQGGIKGSKVKTEINSIATQNNIVICGLVNCGGAITVLSIVIDGVLVPGLAGISDSQHYTKGSVDSCKSKMSSVGLILGNLIGAFTCDLKKVPPIIQIGDSGI